jgi:hypothetical protein
MDRSHLSILLLLLILGFPGCASNQVSFSQWRSRATLVDSQGRVSEGKATFHFGYRDGTLEIPGTSYGDLTGRFATQTPSVSSAQVGVAAVSGQEGSIVVPALSSQNMQLGSSHGTAYLTAAGTVVLQCNIGVDFKTMGMGDAQMVGGGVCADREGKVSRLYFGR